MWDSELDHEAPPHPATKKDFSEKNWENSNEVFKLAHCFISMLIF